MSTPIPPDVAAHVLHHFGAKGGREPGTFTALLISTIACADLETRDRLGLLFPEHVAAVTAMKYDPDGRTALQKAAQAKPRCVHCGNDTGPWGGTPDQPTCEGCVETRGAA